MIDLET